MDKKIPAVRRDKLQITITSTRALIKHIVFGVEGPRYSDAIVLVVVLARRGLLDF